MPKPRQKTILKSAAMGGHVNVAKAMAWAAATHGKGRYRQIGEIAAMVLGRQKFKPEEYYVYGLFRQDFDAERRRSYVSKASGEALNRRLSPPGPLNHAGIIDDKLLTAAVLHSAGFPVPPTKALFSTRMSWPGTEMLHDATGIGVWLGGEGNLPAFGKPVGASIGIGGASFLAVSDGSRTVVLGDGRQVAVADLTAEIAAHYPQGYMFQPILRQHPEVEALIGTTVGMLRLVTLRGPGGPELLYVALNLPGANTMTDANAGSPNAKGLVDPATGRILRVQDVSRLCSHVSEIAPSTGKKALGVTLPWVSEAVSLACAIHAMFPGHGILSYDMAMTPEGPVVSEINVNPHHSAYQLSADRGLLNADFRPRIEAALSESRRMAAKAKG